MHLLRLLPRFRRASAEIERLASREGWRRQAIDAYQLERLNAVWAHAQAHVPYYRDMVRRLGQPSRFDSLEQFRATVPILDKDTVRRRPHELLSERAAPGAWQSTGGSTGTVTRVYSEHAAHLETQRCKYRQAAMWGVDIFDRALFLWGHGASFAPGWRGQLARVRRPLEDRLRNRRRLSAYDLSSETLRRHLRTITRWHPRWIYTYSTAAYLLAREAARVGFHCESLAYALLTAEPAHPWLVETVELGLGVPAIREYGSIECGFLAAEWPDRTLRVREDVAMIETLPRGDGRYDIVVTVLRNPSFPLLRYAIADVTDAPLTQPATGFAMLANVAGRDNDLVLSRSGRALHGLWFDDLFEHTAAARRWRVHQQPDGAVSIAVEVDPERPALDLARVRCAVETYLEGYPVVVRAVDQLEQNAAGKHRWIVSDLAASLTRHRPMAAPGAKDRVAAG